MARTKQEAEFVSPEWTQIIKYKFLNYARLNSPETFNLLATEVLKGSMTVQEWAERYEVAGTWIQEWAAKAVGQWKLGVDVIDGIHHIPRPDDGHTDADVFTYSVSAPLPRSRIANGLVRGGRAPYEPGLTDWDVFKLEMHAALEYQLNEYRYWRFVLADGEQPPKRASREIIIPKDLDLYLQKAAVYYFGKMKTQEIAKYPGIATDRVTVNRHLKSALELLDLKPRPKGHKRSA